MKRKINFIEVSDDLKKGYLKNSSDISDYTPVLGEVVRLGLATSKLYRVIGIRTNIDFIFEEFVRFVYIIKTDIDKLKIPIYDDSYSDFIDDITIEDIVCSEYIDKKQEEPVKKKKI